MWKKLSRPVIASILAIWAIASLLIVAQLHSFHSIAFWPDASLGARASGAWTLTHVLGQDCKCSSVVSKYLLKRGVQPSIQENVLILGKDQKLADQFAAAGFSVQQRSPESLDPSEKALGVPFLIINSPSKEAVYAGGYGDAKVVSGSPIHDLEILDSLRGGRAPASFPVFGCVASLKFQKLTDPFHIKYNKSEPTP